jgi:hypothetical protein
MIPARLVSPPASWATQTGPAKRDGGPALKAAYRGDFGRPCIVSHFGALGNPLAMHLDNGCRQKPSNIWRGIQNLSIFLRGAYRYTDPGTSMCGRRTMRGKVPSRNKVTLTTATPSWGFDSPGSNAVAQNSGYWPQIDCCTTDFLLKIVVPTEEPVAKAGL